MFRSLAKSIFLTCLASSTTFAEGVKREPAIENLSHYAGVLNIEGGKIPKTMNPKTQIWLNYGFVLDTPFDQQGLNHEELTRKNPYPMKEASIVDYDEAKVNLFTLASLRFYIEHAHDLLKKPADKAVRIAFFVHRGTTGPVYLNHILVPWLKSLKNNAHIGSASYHLKNKNVYLDLQSGYTDMDTLDFSNYDIVISWSLFAGIDQYYKTSDLIIPQQFIPYELETNEVRLDKQYFVENHVLQTYRSILQSIDSELVEWVKHNAQSLNKAKVNDLMQGMLKMEAHISPCLEASALFNPKNLSSFFDVHLPAK